MIRSRRVDELPTPQQAEDAAANALGQLIVQGIESRMAEPGTTFDVAARATAHDLLRWPVDEDYSRRPGGYCMRAPIDPVLRAIAHVGAGMVELSYTVRDPARALAEAVRLFAELDRHTPAGNARSATGPAAGASGGTPAGNAGYTAGPTAGSAGPTAGSAGATAGTLAGNARSAPGTPAVGAVR
jgi:hypothetical protein